MQENKESGQSDSADSQKSSDKVAPYTKDDLPQPWQEAMGRAGWQELMPVQAQATPYLHKGRDIMVQSRTGSGKTGAFILPTLDLIDEQDQSCQALVLVPTRELAEQVSRDAQILAGDNGVKVTAVYGGVRYKKQLMAFEEGAQLVVGTPGRILDHLIKRTLRLKDLKMLIFDEADRLLSIGFYPDMREIQRYLPERRVQSCMFSATFPPRVQRLAQQFLYRPEFLGLSSDNVNVADIEHIYYVLPGMEKDRGLVRIIEQENPDSAIIFCNTKNRVHYIAVVLRRFGYDADELSADLSQRDREKVLERVRAGKLRFLVATDVAARGIDIPDLSHVFQYEPPEDLEVYIHRAGRTGRAGSSGKAITLIDRMERPQLKRIITRYKVDLQEMEMPSPEDVAETVTERVAVLLENKKRTRDNLLTERMQRFVPLAAQLAESEDGQLLMAMLLDDYYQESLHAPAVPAPEKPPRQQSSKQRSGGRRGRGRGRSRGRNRGRSNN